MDKAVFSLLTAYSGGAVGVVLGFLSQALVRNLLKKDLYKYQHQLDVKKEQIQSDLMLYANQHKITYSVFDEKRRQAIEKIYTGIMRTTPMRVPLELKVNPITKMNLSAAEFADLYREDHISIMRFLDSAINRVNQVNIDLNDLSIYFSQEIEDLIRETLDEIAKAYNSATTHMISLSKYINILVAKKALTVANEPLDFAEFYDEVCHSWISQTANVRQRLKDTLRDILTPKVYEDPVVEGI